MRRPSTSPLLLIALCGSLTPAQPICWDASPGTPGFMDFDPGSMLNQAIVEDVLQYGRDLLLGLVLRQKLTLKLKNI